MASLGHSVFTQLSDALLARSWSVSIISGDKIGAGHGQPEPPDAKVVKPRFPYASTLGLSWMAFVRFLGVESFNAQATAQQEHNNKWYRELVVSLWGKCRFKNSPLPDTVP